MRLFLILGSAALILFSSCKKSTSPEPIPHNKALIWDKTYGGSEYDFVNAQVQLTTGEYVVSGATRSMDGDVPLASPRGGYDYWIEKIDANGAKVWSKTYGNNNDEYSTGIVSTPDGGVIIVGYEFVNYLNYPKAIKVDGSGNKVWEKLLSQSTDAKPLSIISSGDGNFLVAGYEKVSRGDRDGWVLKLAGDGNIIWTKNFGGVSEDQFSSIVRMPDGNFAVSGFAKSSGGDIANNKGDFDAWLLKMDANGTKAWSQTWGSSGEDYFKSLVTASDGGIVAAGYTTGNNGDISGSKGGHEAWVMKVDASGNKVWSKTFGGLNEEYITAVAKTTDDGFIIAGYTNSTTGDVVRLNNDFGCWIVKLDASGNKTATSTYGNRYDEFINSIIATTDGGHLIGGYQDSDKGYNGLLVKIGPL